MLISVVVPVYNVKTFLNKCIESIINQTYHNFELILVDDGSTDGSAEICDKYSEKYDYIFTYHKKNGGLSDARNYGVKRCKGRYITFVDADDWIDLDYLSVSIRELENSYPELLILPYKREFKNKSVENLLFCKDRVQIKGKRQISKVLLRRIFGPLNKELAHPARVDDLSTAWGKFYKASICKQIQFVDTKIIGTEDAWYNINYINQIKSALYIDSTFYHYNKINDNSLVTKYNPNLVTGWTKLYEFMFSFIEKNNLPDQFVEAVNNRIIVNIIGLSMNIFNSSMRYRDKLSLEKRLLNRKIYEIKFKSFDFSYLVFPWNTFFSLAKNKKAYSLSMLIILGLKLRKVLKSVI